MAGLDPLDLIFAGSAFLFQIVLIVHFALRKWRFQTAIRYGPIVYALSMPAALLSLALMIGGRPWFLWMSGFLYLLWAAFGYSVEYRKKIEFRNSWRWGILGPYLLLYLATVMFYWFPLSQIYKPLWYAYGVLFLISTILNVTSHQPGSKPAGPVKS